MHSFWNTVCDRCNCYFSFWAIFALLRLKKTAQQIKIFKKWKKLVESAKFENSSFPYKIAMSEANVKANRMVSRKQTYHKEQGFTSNYFIFLEILFQFNTLL